VFWTFYFLWQLHYYLSFFLWHLIGRFVSSNLKMIVFSSFCSFVHCIVCLLFIVLSVFCSLYCLYFLYLLLLITPLISEKFKFLSFRVFSFGYCVLRPLITPSLKFLPFRLFLTFSCIICFSSIYNFSLHLWYLQTFLIKHAKYV